MKTLIKAAALSIAVLALALLSNSAPASSSWRDSVQLPYDEIDAYFDGAKWLQNSTQCDGRRDITIIKPIGKSTNFHFTTFPKSAPASKTELTLRIKGEGDCGMMKCYFTYVGPVTYVVMQSNYRDEDTTWIPAVAIGKGKNAETDLDDCRTFERLRVALITEARTIYVTQETDGAFTYQTFNYKSASDKPSLIVKNGKSSLDKAKGIESFTFTNDGYKYEVNVSTSKQPFAEVLVKKAESLLQKERLLAYSYAKKI